MTLTETPSTRARSVVAAAVSARLTTEVGQLDLLGGHVALPDGRLVVFVSGTGPIARAARDLDGRLLLVDLAPVAVPERERARLVLAGTLRPTSAEFGLEAWTALNGGPDGGPCDALALELVLDSVALSVAGVTHRLEPADFLAAEPDPLVAVEAALLQHLASAHRGSVLMLAREAVGNEPSWCATDVVPLRMTRGALTLRVRTADGPRDLDLPFDEPVVDPRRADVAVAALVQRCAEHRATHG